MCIQRAEGSANILDVAQLLLTRSKGVRLSLQVVSSPKPQSAPKPSIFLTAKRCAGDWATQLSMKDVKERPLLPQGIESLKSAPEIQDTAGSSPSRGQSLVCLPTEVLFASIDLLDLLDLPALACFIQTCKGVWAVCLADAVWDRLCGHLRPTVDSDSCNYHKPRPPGSTGTKPTARLASSTGSAQSRTCARHLPSDSKQCRPAGNGNQPQLHNTCIDSNCNVTYSTGVFIANPSWLIYMPKVSSQGSSWLYLKSKTLSGVQCLTLHSLMHFGLQL